MNSLVCGIVAILIVSECANCVKIQFFRERNFTDLNYESNSTAKCNNLPADKKDVPIKSIKTDTCLMVYLYPNCESISKKFDLNNTVGIFPVRSFQICNSDIGGPQLKIDIVKNYDFSKTGVLKSYRDVCTCINVPEYVQNLSNWSVNNYGNDFMAYYQPNCSENKWDAEHVPAGLSCDGSACMHEYVKTDRVTKSKYKIQSIGPNPNSKYFQTSCTQVPANNQTVDSVRVENVYKVISREELQNFQQKQDQHFSSLDAKNNQLRMQIETLTLEMEAMQENTVELESKLENHYRSLEVSFKKLRDEFDNFVLKFDHKMSKLVNF